MPISAVRRCSRNGGDFNLATLRAQPTSRRNCHGVKKLPPNLARLADEPVLKPDFLDSPFFLEEQFCEDELGGHGRFFAVVHPFLPGEERACFPRRAHSPPWSVLRRDLPWARASAAGRYGSQNSCPPASRKRL